jgi:hypothetical protein
MFVIEVIGEAFTIVNNVSVIVVIVRLVVPKEVALLLRVPAISVNPPDEYAVVNVFPFSVIE